MVQDSEEAALYAGIGTALRQTRHAQHWTQQQLADAIGHSRTSIVNIEQGNQRLPLHTLLSIAQALNVPLVALLPAMCHAGATLPVLWERDREQLAACSSALRAIALLCAPHVATEDTDRVTG